MTAKKTNASTQSSFLLPELCRSEALLGLILLAQLLVLVLVLAEPIQHSFNWSRLALFSLFVQWVVLLSAALLCRIRPWLDHLPIIPASCIICSLVMLLTLLCSMATHYLHTEFLGISLQSETLGYFYLRNTLISLIMSMIVLRVLYLQARYRRKQQAELQARLAALQARIEPHFLFNTLNSIACLIHSDPNKAEQAILDLSDLLRANLSRSDEMPTWQQELLLARQYLSIETYRFGDRLNVIWDVDSVPNNLPIPRLTLQPLLENAIIHGIQPLAEGGCIHIKADYQAGIFNLRVSNPRTEHDTSHAGLQLALDNTRTRLFSYFGTQAQLKTVQTDTEFIAHISYPCQLNPPEAASRR